MRINTNRRNPGAVVRHIVQRLENGRDTTTASSRGGADAVVARRRRSSLNAGPPTTERPAEPGGAGAVAAEGPQ